MAKPLFKILSMLIFGALGGIFADRILSPYFFPEQTTVNVTETKEITNYIQENVALREVIEKVGKTAVAVKTKTENGNILLGSGLMASNDGFVVTLAELLPQGNAFSFYFDGKWREYQVLKRDLKNNLALVKLEGSGFTTAGFADLEKMKIGERVFTAGFDFSSTTPRLIVNEGIVKIFDQDIVMTNILDGSQMAGAPLFNIEGNAAGLSIIDELGRVSAIPVAKMRSFIGF